MLRITKTGILEETDDGDWQPPDFLPHRLLDYAQIDEGVSLRDFLNCMSKEEETLLVVGVLYKIDIAWMRERNLEATLPGAPMDANAKLVVSWTTNDHLVHGQPDYIEHDVGFDGPCDDDTVIPLDMVKVAEIAHFPLMLDEALQEGGNRHFTLLEVVGEIYGELCFLGSTKERDDMMNSMRALDL